jgi:hypothetical protein
MFLAGTIGVDSPLKGVLIRHAYETLVILFVEGFAVPQSSLSRE